MAPNTESGAERAAAGIPAALAALPLRLVLGWTFFSAFWRRVVLKNALDPNAAEYVGQKFNHFLPHALGIKPMLEYLVATPALLAVTVIVFTVIEGVVGLCLMLGLFTRLMSVGVVALAFSILLGAGWLGSTCLDEWQIGVLGIAGGCALFFSGGGRYSLDAVVRRRWPGPASLRWLTSGAVPVKTSVVLFVSAATLFLTLGTNQYFHGGVYGTLHNDSVKPELVVTDGQLHGNTAEFTVSRTAGPDTYGSFVIDAAITDRDTGRQVSHLDAIALSAVGPGQITNHKLVHVSAGAHSLVVPLGAEARISVTVPGPPIDPKGRYAVRLIDVSGAQWTAPLDTRA
ncbi:DoxX family membrane protein [Mycobacterium sp. CBMA293]|uniref:TQO small subunit DoxD n=1 Tax=unclassified Mycolicibacterium TaxID=2636767 RepID=UPI0012DC912F|nr:MULTISPECIES: TQO small subunit DoxD [unclassified Mycolicibacterium]MUL48624.1 DoxX family membrane protein [Mycolicibacterium sp. CBMA 360]MUL60878.1 DoxX family membrane protein [Mycolicibacterium sp. CBMA 335]MUL71891.1 DoxX family membrane protein [Mycolicibacterium sp. CBMA 311]MUL95819.1 DoxX family membrane protein [Mycolicibacterium sp. CBMA 230]MUM06417.1 quinol oxidase [Mycolicibacterium sp. CBMA 213]